MKDKNNKEIIEDEEDKKSNTSVLNLSLGSAKELNKESISSENISDIKKELMSEINLPIENENDLGEFVLEEKEKEIVLENKFFSENNLKIKEKEEITRERLKARKRSKSFGEKRNLKKKYCHIKKEPSVYISPLKLCRKTFGNNQKWNKKPNEVLCDFQKTIIDSNSCNDDDSQNDFFLSYSETERSTPNHEDLSNLLNCRKKMTLFKNCINDRNFKEYENILTTENIFINRKNLNKKNNFWHKHIRQILRENNNKNPNSFLSRLSAGSIINNNLDKNKEDGLFILGILESAVNERKGRYTTNI
jgi:hypothetical protein